MNIILFVAGLVGIVVLGNYFVVRKFHQSLMPTAQITKRILSWAEWIYFGMQRLSLATRSFIRQAYEGFGLRYLILVMIVGLIALVAINSEFGFIRHSFADFLNETPDTTPFLFGLPLSGILGLFLVGVAAIVGFILFDGLSITDTVSNNSTSVLSQTTDQTDANANNHNNDIANRAREYRNEATNDTAQGIVSQRQVNSPSQNAERIAERKKSFYWKLGAFNVLLVISVLQACLGYQRADEFILTANMGAQISGQEVINPPSSSLVFSLVNAFIGLLAPFVTAFTTKYLLTLLTWVVGSLLAIILTLFLWLPTWLLNGVVVRYQQEAGTPPEESGMAENVTQPAETIESPTPQPPPEPIETSETEQVFTERADEEREELHERREAERRRHDQANFNPFGA